MIARSHRDRLDLLRFRRQHDASESNRHAKLRVFSYHIEHEHEHVDCDCPSLTQIGCPLFPLDLH